jgi:two-component sensor histidine kinase
MLGLARWLSLGIMRPILELLRLAAREEREEGAVPEGGLGLPEADRLAHALLVQARRRRAATAALVESERRLRLVVAELNHRAKNALATVQALALQTARGDAGADPTHFTEAFTGRLQTLARAHDLLTALSWEGAALGAVVEAGLAPWLEAEAGAAQRRLTLRCDCDLPLPLAAPGQVQALVMALHELATNATKHGALSVPEGRVEVSCQADVVQSRATVLWRERGGPPVPGRPARGGFGTRLLERAVARDLGPEAQVVLDYAPEGLSARISFSPRLQPGTVPAG